MNGHSFKDLEAGALSRSEFCDAFSAECLKEGHKVDGEAWLRHLEEGFEPDILFLAALEELRRNGFLIGIITNNWKGFNVDASPNALLRFRPDVLIESYKVKIRKPSKEIYELCQRELAKKVQGQKLNPEEIVFLDDIG